MHKHILTKVWDQRWDDCNTHTHTQCLTEEPMFASNYCIGGGEDVEQSGGHKYMY